MLYLRSSSATHTVLTQEGRTPSLYRASSAPISIICQAVRRRFFAWREDLLGAGGRPGADERGGWGVLGGIFLVLVELPSGSEEAMEWLQSQDPPALHPGTTVNHNPITVPWHC